MDEDPTGDGVVKAEVLPDFCKVLGRFDRGVVDVFPASFK